MDNRRGAGFPVPGSGLVCVLNEMRKKRVKALREIMTALRPGTQDLPDHVARLGFARVKGKMEPNPRDRSFHGAYWWRQIKKLYKQGGIKYADNTESSTGIV